MANVYIENGYDSRRHYLECLAEEYGIDVKIVFEIASMLGSSEDFDGLLTSLEEYEAMMEDEF